MKKFALTVTLLGLWAIRVVHAAEFFCQSGDVTCLIDAINQANQNGDEDTINLAAGTYTLTSIDNVPDSNNGRNGLPRIVSPMIINGESAESTIIERDQGAPAFRIFDIELSGKLTINGLSIRGGFGNGISGAGLHNFGTLIITNSIITQNFDGGIGGGGIHNEGTLTLSHTFVTRNTATDTGNIKNLGVASIVNSSIIRGGANGTGGIVNVGGIMTIQNSTISHNGGGVLNDGIMTIENSTIAHNIENLGGGAGISTFGGILKITNSTISQNEAVAMGPNSGAGLFVFGGIVELQNTIIALNTNLRNPSLPGQDCFGPATSLGNNLIGNLTGCNINLLPSDLMGDPGLGDFIGFLAIGDSTPNEPPGTGHFPLQETSQAIDAGNDVACPTKDQLGLPRVGNCDIGAIEFQGQMVVFIDIRPRSDANKINPNGSGNINVAILSGNGFDARTVDPNTVRFGATGTEAAPINVARRDVDEDGDRDMVVRFQIPDTGIKCGDTSAILTGQISGGPSIIGSSPIRTAQC